MVAHRARATAARSLEPIRYACGTTVIRRGRTSPPATAGLCRRRARDHADHVAAVRERRDLDSPDHAARMADAVHVGRPFHVCPSTQPVPLPQITVQPAQVVREAAGRRTVSCPATRSGSRRDHPARGLVDDSDRSVVATFVTPCIDGRRDCGGGTLGDGTALSWFSGGRR